MGYSMGARITAFLCLQRPDLVSRAVFAGLAERMVLGVPGSEEIALAMQSPTRDEITDKAALAFRIFAEQTKSDVKALAACIRSSRVKLKPEALAKVSCPVLIVAGEQDEISGPVQPLVDMIPTATGVVLPGRNHMNAVGDPGYKKAVLGFLGPQ
jgi:pimeloyl-ACP methyl ester carboxylesterase